MNLNTKVPKVPAGASALLTVIVDIVIFGELTDQWLGRPIFEGRGCLEKCEGGNNNSCNVSSNKENSTTMYEDNRTYIALT